VVKPEIIKVFLSCSHELQVVGVFPGLLSRTLMAQPDCFKGWGRSAAIVLCCGQRELAASARRAG